MMRLSFLLSALMLITTIAQADVVIIGHPAGPDSISVEQVRDIYLNRSRALPDGQRPTPYELPEGHPSREAFHNAVTGRSNTQLKAFWSQQVFTGKGQPPREASNDTVMKSSVALSPGGIGYIDDSLVDDSIKVILRP